MSHRIPLSLLWLRTCPDYRQRARLGATGVLLDASTSVEIADNWFSQVCSRKSPAAETYIRDVQVDFRPGWIGSINFCRTSHLPFRPDTFLATQLPSTRLAQLYYIPRAGHSGPETRGVLSPLSCSFDALSRTTLVSLLMAGESWQKQNPRRLPPRLLLPRQQLPPLPSPVDAGECGC